MPGTPDDFPFDEISPWIERPTDLQPALTDDIRVDVAIVGAGYTGLSTALALRAQGVDVALLEQDFAGSGASGRNAGHLTPTIGKDIPTLQRLFGPQRTATLIRFADAAVEHTEEVIRKRGIDCEYEPTGNVMAAVHPKHEKKLRRAADAARASGARACFLSEAEMRERGLPRAFRCGVLEENGGHLHPGRYVAGLRRAALAAGVRLHEATTVSEIEPGVPVVVRSGSGSVTADAAVVATNAYTMSLGWKPRLVAPLRVSLFETGPLSTAQLAEIGWRGREGIYTTHESLESYRLTARQTIVGGAKHVSMAFGRALPPAWDPVAFRVIERAFRDRFPSLGAVPMACYWGGWIGLTLDFLPALHVDGNVVTGVGYCGHGVAQATLMGELIAERVQGREHELEAALGRRRLQWMPEPARWVCGKLLQKGLEAVDRRTDGQARRLDTT